MTRLTDACGRQVHYLRISVTDRCNLCCSYCMPPEGIPLLAHADILSYEEIARVARIAVKLGFDKLRLTGGEPLARKGLVGLVSMLGQIEGLSDLSMTTNGTLLASHAMALRQAGLHRVNISLDTLKPGRYRAITRGGALDDTLAGIEAAHAAGLEPVKINMVVLSDMNADEVVDFAARSLTHGWHVRLIERMAIGIPPPEGAAGMDVAEMRARIEAVYGALEPADLHGSGPAQYWRIAGAPGTIGLIAADNWHLCGSCNRLRLSADGRVLPCLFSSLEYDLRTPLRRGADDNAIAELLSQIVAAKPAGRRRSATPGPAGRAMSRTGG